MEHNPDLRLPDQETLSLEERVARLEGRLGWRRIDYRLAARETWGSGALLVLALLCSIKGLGLPNHWYQAVLAVLVIVVAYHREWLVRPHSTLVYSLLLTLNTALVATTLKLLIGSGTRHPFFWALVPAVSSEKDSATQAWHEVLPKLSLVWQESPLAQWAVDLTAVQTFLLLITLFGALFEFQPFVSLTALLLIIVSIPALVSFSWTWIFPALILTAVAFYLQSASYQEDF